MVVVVKPKPIALLYYTLIPIPTHIRKTIAPQPIVEKKVDILIRQNIYNNAKKK